jgi:transmembrane sensor
MSLPSDGLPTEAIQEEAFIWLGRLVDGEVTRPELQAFKRWQGMSPAHSAAFEIAKRQWRAMKPALAGALRKDPAMAARHRRLVDGGRPNAGRRAALTALAGAGAAAAVAAVFPPFGLWPSAAGGWRADYRTATGEQRALGLAQGVQVVLNTRTSVRCETAASGRVDGINLIEGEAAVDLAEGARPFAVVAGAGQSQAGAGQFEVRRTGDSVRVACIAGSVQVWHAAGVRMLRASEQTVYDDSSISGVWSIDAGEVSAWRKGELVFNQTPLTQVIAEINRYRPGRIVLMADRAGTRPVVGTFRIAVLDEAVLQLQHAFGLNARALPGGLLVLS